MAAAMEPVDPLKVAAQLFRCAESRAQQQRSSKKTAALPPQQPRFAAERARWGIKPSLEGSFTRTQRCLGAIEAVAEQLRGGGGEPESIAPLQRRRERAACVPVLPPPPLLARVAAGTTAPNLQHHAVLRPSPRRNLLLTISSPVLYTRTRRPHQQQHRDQPPGFPFEGYDLEELILPDGDDMGVRSDEEPSEEGEVEAETGFGSVIGERLRA